MPKRELYKVKEVPSKRLSDAITKAFLRDFKRYGISTIERVREDNPAEYLRICTKLLPKQVDIGVQHSFSDVLLAAAAEIQADAIDSQAIEIVDDSADRPGCDLVGPLPLGVGVGTGGGG